MSNFATDQTTPRPEVRYIKLGRNNVWAERALTRGELPFGHRNVPHELALSGDAQQIHAHLTNLGRAVMSATSFTREILAFYGLGRDAIWISFANGRLWWANAEPTVEWLGLTDDYAPRIRRTVDGWRDKDALGRTLLSDQLSTKLTKVASFRQTLCRVEAEDYLLRKLAGEEEPLVRRASDIRASTVAVVEEMLAQLHWADFETLIDVILGRGGWQRTSRVGGTMKDADLIVEQSLTGETALVQVKSVSDQRELDHYVSIFRSNPSFSRMIFVCHSPRSELDARGSNDVLVWTRERLAETVIRNGLFDWLMARIA